MKQVLLTLWTIILATGLNAQTIDNAKSKVTFEIDNMKVNTVEGSFGGMKGDVNFDNQSPEKSSFNVTIDVASINTGIDKRDKHLRSKDFFEVDRYPLIRYKSDDVIKARDGYIAKGTLTIKDVSRKVNIPFTIGKAGSMTTFTGYININRLDYYVGEDVSTFTVGEEVKVKIYCVVNK